MRHPIHDLPVVFDHGENYRVRRIEWGDMIVVYETSPAGGDAAPLFKGLPDDMCQSPHWCYVLKGRMRVHYADGSEEVLQAGDVGYLKPGHLVVVEEDLEILQFNPKDAYQQTMEVVARNLAAMEGVA